MRPLLNGHDADISPWAMPAPIWIDADGDGKALGRRQAITRFLKLAVTADSEIFLECSGRFDERVFAGVNTHLEPSYGRPFGLVAGPSARCPGRSESREHARS